MENEKLFYLSLGILLVQGLTGASMLIAKKTGKPWQQILVFTGMPSALILMLYALRGLAALSSIRPYTPQIAFAAAVSSWIVLVIYLWRLVVRTQDKLTSIESARKDESQRVAFLESRATSLTEIHSKTLGLIEQISTSEHDSYKNLTGYWDRLSKKADDFIWKTDQDLQSIHTALNDVPNRKEFEERLGNLLEFFDRESSKRINDAIKPVAQRLASMRGTWLNALIPCPAQRRCSGAKALPRKEHYYLPGAALQKEPGLSVVPTDDPTGQIYVCPTCYMDIVGIAPDSDPRTTKVS